LVAVALQLCVQPLKLLFIQAIKVLQGVQQHLESFAVVHMMPFYARNPWAITPFPSVTLIKL
jgi:hypothetical protein